MTDASDGSEAEQPTGRDVLAALTDEVLGQLGAQADADRAARDQAANRTNRPCLGVPSEALNALAKDLRARLTVDRRVMLADALWRTGGFDARLLALRLLTQARIRPDGGVWSLLERWVHDLDCRALADAHAAAAGRRITAYSARLDVVADWTGAANVWTRRTALEATRPWAKDNNPAPADLEIRERVLGWAEAMADDGRPVIRQAVDTWLRDLGKRDPERVAAFQATAAR